MLGPEAQPGLARHHSERGLQQEALGAADAALKLDPECQAAQFALSEHAPEVLVMVTVLPAMVQAPLAVIVA